MYTVCVRNSPLQIETSSSTTFHDRTFQAIAQIVGSLNLIQPAKDVGGTYGYLVGGAITIFKNDGVRQWEGLFHPIYEMENNPAMFETINQLWIPWSKHPKNLENNHGFPRGMKWSTSAGFSKSMFTGG